MNIFQYMVDEYCKEKLDSIIKAENTEDTTSCISDVNIPTKASYFEPGVPYKPTVLINPRDELKSQTELNFDKYNANIPMEDTDLEERLILSVKVPKTSKDFLKKCIEVQDARAAEYEQNGAERSFNKVAMAFNAITGKDLSAAEIALILQILKDVRAWSTESLHMDSLIDGISYASLKAELLVEQHRNTK